MVSIFKAGVFREAHCPSWFQLKYMQETKRQIDFWNIFFRSKNKFNVKVKQTIALLKKQMQLQTKLFPGEAEAFF